MEINTSFEENRAPKRNEIHHEVEEPRIKRHRTDASEKDNPNDEAVIIPLEPAFDSSEVIITIAQVIKDGGKSIGLIKDLATTGNTTAQVTLAHLSDYGFELVSINLKQAFRLYQLAADKQNPEALTQLANFFYDGFAVPKDRSRAFELYQRAATLGSPFAKVMIHQEKKLYENEIIETIEELKNSAESGNPISQYYIGHCYCYGTGIAKSYEECVKWYEKGAVIGHAGAQSRLGTRFFYGEGVTQDCKKAVYWYERSAKQGFCTGQHNLAICYQRGEGIETDISKAIDLYKLASDQDYYNAQYNLADCYSRGEGVEKNLKVAAYWYERAANLGDVDSQVIIGDCYRFGDGVDIDLSKAVHFYECAAKQDDPDAQVGIGYCYSTGTGVQQDFEKAIYWYEKASAQGNSSAKFNLGNRYRKGQGVPKDLGKALEYYLAAADLGHNNAIYNAANLLFKGEGPITKDLTRASHLLRKSARAGNKHSQKLIDEEPEIQNEIKKIRNEEFWGISKILYAGRMKNCYEDGCLLSILPFEIFVEVLKVLKSCQDK